MEEMLFLRGRERISLAGGTSLWDGSLKHVSSKRGHATAPFSVRANHAATKNLLKRIQDLLDARFDPEKL